MKQYNEAGTLFEAAQSWDKAASVYIKTKHWSKVGELMKHITSPKLLIQYAKAKETDSKYVLRHLFMPCVLFEAYLFREFISTTLHYMLIQKVGLKCILMFTL